MEFTTDSVRAAILTPRLQRMAVASVAGRLLSELTQFTGDPVVLPIPNDAPPEVPRVILRDDEGLLQLQVALERTDLVMSQRTGGPALNIEAAFVDAVKILEVAAAALGVRPSRLAALANMFHRCPDPAARLAEHFAREQWVADGGSLSGLRGFELHALRRKQLLEGLIVNSWVRCKTGVATEANISSPAIILERDVNTLPEEIRNFDQEAVEGFFRTAATELTAEIPRFFPADGGST